MKALSQLAILACVIPVSTAAWASRTDPKPLDGAGVANATIDATDDPMIPSDNLERADPASDGDSDDMDASEAVDQIIDLMQNNATAESSTT